MKYEPHEYQKYATRFIEEKPEAAILLDMGLGKTSITLTAIDHLMFDSFDIHKVLVIAPLRVARDFRSILCGRGRNAEAENGSAGVRR